MNLSDYKEQRKMQMNLTIEASDLVRNSWLISYKNIIGNPNDSFHHPKSLKTENISTLSPNILYV